MGIQQNLLIVGDSPHDLPQLARGMMAHGWSARLADLHQAPALMEAHPLTVGLMCLSVAQPPRIADLENVIDGGGTHWVALVDREPERGSPLAQLLDQLFLAYHILPADDSQLDCLLRHALAMTHLTQPDQRASGRHAVDEHKMVGSTPVIHTLLRTIRKAAMVDAPIFINGESGTGKELAARAIHEQSRRAKGPFNAINCGALPSNLIQSELFGHEKGAFTGADQRRIGHLEATAGGTLFLDEIGDLPLDMQVNLLRFLENHRIQRIGSLEEIAVDVRVIAATHVDLEKAVADGHFREDLYHRLNVLEINIPPLCERQDDIELLAQFYFNKFSNEKSLKVRGFSQEALTLLRQHNWPGNVRELINRVRRAMIMCEQRLIRPADLGLERRQCSRKIITLAQARDMAECEVVKAALARNKDKIQHAAKELDISRVTLYRLIDKHNIIRGDESVKLEDRAVQHRAAGKLAVDWSEE